MIRTLNLDTYDLPIHITCASKISTVNYTNLFRDKLVLISNILLYFAYNYIPT